MLFVEIFLTDFNLLVIVLIFWFLNKMYLLSDTFFWYFISWCLCLMKKSLYHQIVFRPEFFPIFAWVYDNICYGLQHIRSYFFSCDCFFHFLFSLAFSCYIVVMMCFCIALSSSWPSFPSFWSWDSLLSLGLVYAFVFWLSRVVLYLCSSHNQSNTLHYFWGLACHWSCLPLFLHD